MQPAATKDAIERLAGEQWNVLTLDDLRRAGLSRQQIRTMLGRGQLHLRHPGVYSYGHPTIAWQGVLLAAQYACGTTSFLSHQTALALNGLRKPYLGEIHVTVVRTKVAPADRKIRVHRTTIAPELRRNGPLRFTTIPRALLDLAATGATVKRLTDLITEAIHQHKLNHPQMLETLERHHGAPGTRRLKEAYAYYLPRPSSKSDLERSFDKRLKRRPWIPEPQRNINMLIDGRIRELDRYFAEHKVLVEMDGRDFHTAQAEAEGDRVRDAKLARLGIVVLRFTDLRWGDEPDDCLDDLEAVLVQRVGPDRHDDGAADHVGPGSAVVIPQHP
jgi:putative AbiEi antitoxin of type IV toxin-antitoxin system/uncharacterized protein DUF559